MPALVRLWCLVVSFPAAAFFNVAAKGDFSEQRFQVACRVVPIRLEREGLGEVVPSVLELSSVSRAVSSGCRRKVSTAWCLLPLAQFFWAVGSS